MIKILYLPCHAILEYDELKLFTELGYDWFSIGSYVNPATPHDTIRPPLQGKYYPHLLNLLSVYSKDRLHKELVDPFDVIIVQHIPQWIANNWEIIKHKKVIWRTIGQASPNDEAFLAPYRNQGLKIVRYSPYEASTPGFIGQDAIIRFYKDPEEFKDWNGKDKKAVTFVQSPVRRDVWSRLDLLRSVTEGLPRKIYGRETELLGDYGGGLITYEEMKKILRDSRVYFFTGTYPASYTLSFVEAFMTGIPIVAIGNELANIRIFPDMNAYEVHTLIRNGINGFVSDNPAELRKYIKDLLENDQLAQQISENARKEAIALFGKEMIKKQWKDFLENI